MILIMMLVAVVRVSYDVNKDMDSYFSSGIVMTAIIVM